MSKESSSAIAIVIALGAVAACTGSGDSAPASSDGGSALDGSSAVEGGSHDAAVAGPGTSVVTFDSNVESIVDLRVDGTDVFYTRVKLSSSTFKKANLEKMPIGGGTAAPTVVAADVVEPSYLAVDATHVYFARHVCNAAIPCGVYRVAKSGGAVQTLAESPDGGMPIVVTGLAVDDTYVYFGADNHDRLFRVKKDGSAALEGLTTSDVGIRGIQVDAQFVYWVDATVGTVKFFRLAKSGTTAEALATLTGASVGHTPENVRAASMTDTEIVWADTGDEVGSDNQIVRLPKTPGGATTAVKTGLRFVGSAQVLGADVYFTDGSLKKVPLAGGEPQTLAGYPVNPTTLTPIAVDATGVYWITLRDIRRLAP